MQWYFNFQVWNELPAEVVNAGSLLTFKKNLDRYMDERGLEGCRVRVQVSGTRQKNGLAQPRRAKGHVSVLECSMVLWLYLSFGKEAKTMQ